MRKLAGFTLLEIMVSLAIVGMTMGTTFALLSQSKRLAFKAADDIEQTSFIRAYLNLSQLIEKPDYPAQPDTLAKQWTLEIGDILEKVERQSRPTRYALEPITLKNEETGQTFANLRLKKLDSAR